MPPSGLQTNYVTSENKSITFGCLLCKTGNLIIPKLSFVKPVNLCRLLDTCKNCVLLEVLFLSFALNKKKKKHIHDIYLEMLHILSSQNIPFSLLSVSSHPPLRKHTHTQKNNTFCKTVGHSASRVWAEPRGPPSYADWRNPCTTSRPRSRPLTRNTPEVTNTRGSLVHMHHHPRFPWCGNVTDSNMSSHVPT